MPYLLVVGDREVEARSISVRSQDGTDLGSLTLEQFVSLVQDAVARRGRVL